MALMKKLKANEVKLLSRRIAVCRECLKKLECYVSLKPHFDTVHEGRPPFEKGQMKLNLPGSPTAKRSTSQNENLLSSSDVSDVCASHNSIQFNSIHSFLTT